jgi:hypothetical protein
MSIGKPRARIWAARLKVGAKCPLGLGVMWCLRHPEPTLRSFRIYLWVVGLSLTALAKTVGRLWFRAGMRGGFQVGTETALAAP